MLPSRRKYRRPCTKNIQKLGSRFNNLLVNRACFHLFAINWLTLDFLAVKSMRQTVVPLSIKKSMRWKCHNCRDMLDLSLCTVADIFFCWVLLLLFIPIWISSSFQFTLHVLLLALCLRNPISVFLDTCLFLHFSTWEPCNYQDLLLWTLISHSLKASQIYIPLQYRCSIQTLG